MQVKATVLIADDHEHMRSTLSRILALEGYAYHVAVNGRTAIELLESRRVDLALLDINMPVVDGIGVLEHMKANSALADIPIIMLTAQVDCSSVMHCKSLGVADFIVKPYKISVLLQRISQVLQRGL